MTKTVVAMDDGATVPTKVMKYRSKIGRSEFEIKTAKGGALPPGRPPGDRFEDTEGVGSGRVRVRGGGGFDEQF